MYYIHKKELICPKCNQKFTVSWKEWRELMFCFFPEQESYWYKCPSCKHEFGDEERKKREAEFYKTSKLMIAIAVILVIIILSVLGYLIWIMYLS